MDTRKDLVEVFSTFLAWNGDRFEKWITDSRLKRSMKDVFSADPDPTYSSSFLALYWHKVWQHQHPLAGQHLTAYLQETCYYAASKLKQSVQSIHEPLNDCFQIAIAQIPSILHGFRPELGSSLSAFARRSFENAIKGELRTRKEMDICTDWALLRKTHKIQIQQVLEQMFSDANVISAYSLAWKCFKDLHVPNQARGNRQLTSPERHIWEKITQYYNQERLSQLQSLRRVATPEEIESWLTRLAKQVRRFRYPSLKSIQEPMVGLDSVIESVALHGGYQEADPIEVLSYEELQHNVKAVLTEALSQLGSAEREVLELIYRQGMNQTEVAKVLGTKQFAISRQLSRAKKVMLKKLRQWSEKTLHISVTLDVLDQQSSILEDWLEEYYQS